MWKKERVLFDVLHACFTLHPNPHIKSSLTDIGRAHMDIADVVGLELTSPSVAEKGMAERKDGEGKQSRKKSFEAPYIPDNRNHLLFYLFSFFFRSHLRVRDAVTLSWKDPENVRSRANKIHFCLFNTRWYANLLLSSCSLQLAKKISIESWG